MTSFGDDEPEDAWHPDDPPSEQVDQLRRRLALLLLGEGDGDLFAELLLLSALLDRLRGRREEPRELLRAEQLDEDIHHVLGRLP